MSRHEDDQSVHNEPHLRPGSRPADPSERAADKALRRDARRSGSDYRDKPSVYDEPDIFAGRAAEVIEQDWNCSGCGYNLRGLPAGHPCPECGHRELYRPAPTGSASYQSWLRERISRTSPAKAWMVAVLLALCGGPWALLATFLGTDSGWYLRGGAVVMLVVFGPAVEETLKIAATAAVVEVRPYLFRRAEQVRFAAAGAALVFAVIENIVYLNVYVPNPPAELVLWRWTVCTALHVGCTTVAVGGLVGVWRQAITQLRPPRLSLGLRRLVIAIVLHATYNAAAFMYEIIR